MSAAMSMQRGAKRAAECTLSEELDAIDGIQPKVELSVSLIR